MSAPAPPLSMPCVAAAFSCAWGNVQLPAIVVLLLLLEAASMALITRLRVVTPARHGFAPDPRPYAASGLHPSSLGLGVVGTLAAFGFLVLWKLNRQSNLSHVALRTDQHRRPGLLRASSRSRRRRSRCW